MSHLSRSLVPPQRGVHQTAGITVLNGYKDDDAPEKERTEEQTHLNNDKLTSKSDVRYGLAWPLPL